MASVNDLKDVVSEDVADSPLLNISAKTYLIAIIVAIVVGAILSVVVK